MFDNDKAARGSIVREVILALDERLAQVVSKTHAQLGAKSLN